MGWRLQCCFKSGQSLDNDRVQDTQTILDGLDKLHNSEKILELNETPGRLGQQALGSTTRCDRCSPRHAS